MEDKWMLKDASGSRNSTATLTCLACTSSEELGIVQQVDRMNWKKTVEAKRKETAKNIYNKREVN